MSYPPLALADDLAPYGTFTDVQVSAACAAVRAEAGWHIAPVVTETVTVYTYGGSFLPLPTRRVIAITAVADLTTGSSVAVTNFTRIGNGLYRSVGPYAAWGVYRSYSAWPFGVVNVTLTHGFDNTPEDLFPVIASRIRQAASTPAGSVQSFSMAIDDYRETTTYASGGSSSTTITQDPVISRYAVLSAVA